jgi:hypothetical protein
MIKPLGQVPRRNIQLSFFGLVKAKVQVFFISLVDSSHKAFPMMPKFSSKRLGCMLNVH